MSNFYTLLTRVGAALHANAQVNQTTVPWTHMRLGDGNGAAVVPTENQTGLVRQVHTLQITDISVHPDNPNWVIVEAVVPSDVGGWTVREAAIYGGADGNTCIAVGNYPETYKPVLAEGAGREMVMRMVVEISSVATVKLQIDPAVAIASRAWVESLVATPAKAGLVKLANLQEHLDGESSSKAATPAGVHAVIGIATEQVMEQVLLDRTRIAKLEDDGGLLQITGNTTLTGADNKLVMAGIVPGLKLERGDVIQIAGAGEVNAKLRTVESIVNNGELILNYEHCGSRGNGPLKLQNYSGPVTITRIAKWYGAADGLGQDWVNVTAFRATSVDAQNSSGRKIEVNVSSNVSAGLFSFFVSGVAIALITEAAGNNDCFTGMSIPPGASYKTDYPSITVWAELR